MDTKMGGRKLFMIKLLVASRITDYSHDFKQDVLS